MALFDLPRTLIFFSRHCWQAADTLVRDLILITGLLLTRGKFCDFDMPFAFGFKAPGAGRIVLAGAISEIDSQVNQCGETERLQTVSHHRGRMW